MTEPNGSDTVLHLEKDGLVLTYDGHWSVQEYFAASVNGRWANLQQVMAKVGLVPRGDGRDLIEAAGQAKAIKSYLDSQTFRTDVRNERHRGMAELRKFQRSIGMKESWLPEERNILHLARESLTLSRAVPLKYWIAGLVASGYLLHELVTSPSSRSIAIVLILLTFIGAVAALAKNKPL
ncbi:hypothetical protein [Sphingomonas lenta]|uniref:hypothetical protein n=1 Tax=Sphingomonas lenta TaxID=1141887 RepID=UPI001140D020|nr:hypothetical protein [Sphingomonas lenta]